MKRNTSERVMTGIALSATLLVGGAWATQSSNVGTSVGTMAQNCQKMVGGAMGRMQRMSCCAPKESGGPTADATQSKDVQRATVTIQDGYTPATLNVKAGKPMELTFVSKGDSCANTVSIPTLDKTLTLKNGQKTIITFTPKEGKTLNFACGMGMYQGKIVAK